MNENKIIFSTDLFLWIPTLILFGILSYFKISPSLDIKYYYIILIFLIALTYRIKENLYIRYSLVTLFCFTLGYTAIYTQSLSLHTITIDKEIFYTKIQAKVESITPVENGNRLLLSDVKIEKWKKTQPNYIRLLSRTDIGNLKSGNYVILKANIKPPEKPILPGMYDFARMAYFNKIGAVGYIVSKIEVQPSRICDNKCKINNLRNYISNIVISTIGKEKGYIATALMIGEYKGINQKILQNMRASGLSHILAVSGMHLSLVGAICYFFIRQIFQLFPTLLLRFNTKKISACFAIIFSFVYFMISGMQVAAERAFIMFSLMILAIIFDRQVSPLRSCAIAALIILIINPFLATSPSFHMSFSAVIALISSYELVTKYKPNFYSDQNIFRKILKYFLSLILSSFVASFATAPFVAYHFNNFSNYGILANLIAVPITSFILMPCVVIAFFLIPIGLEFIPLQIMAKDIEIIIQVAEYTANLPKSNIIIPHISDYSIFFITFGSLWLIILQSKIRFLGILLILLSFISFGLTKKPDILISRDYNFAFIENDKIYFSSRRPNKNVKTAFINYTGIKDNAFILDPINGSKNVTCTINFCLWEYKNKKIFFNVDENIDVCKSADLIITKFSLFNNCPEKIIDKKFLERQIPQIIYLK